MSKQEWPIILAVIVGIVALAVLIWYMMANVKSTTKSLKLLHLGSGKMLADGSEQMLFEFICTQPFTFDGWVNLKNMQVGDQVILKQYAKLGIDKEYGEFDSEPYTGAQVKPMVFISPVNALYGIKVILQQTEGTFREFEWEFYRGVTS